MRFIGHQRRSVLAIGILIALAAACSGGSTPDAADGAGDDSGATTVADDSTPTSDTGDVNGSTSSTDTASTTEPAAALAVASAALIEDNVDYRTGTQVEFATLTEPVDVAVGDTVRTDTTGYGEIAYFDGSLTRLDINTEFEVIALVDDPGNSEIRTRMGTGRTWHRVEQLTGDDTYEVDTSVATATVRGTAFSIACPDDTSCRFAVAEGTIEIELPDGTVQTLTAPAAIDVTPDGFGDEVALPFDAMFDDEWIFDNAGRDTVEGFETAAAIYQTHGPQYASLSGTYTGTLTDGPISECDPNCLIWTAFYDIETDPNPKPRTFVLDLDCSSGLPCTGTGEIERAAGVETVTLTYDGQTLTFLESSETGTYCLIDFDGDGTQDLEAGTVQESSAYRMTPATAEIVDDRWVVGSFTGSFNNEFAVVDLGRCGEFPDLETGLEFPASGGYQLNTAIEMTRTP